MFSDLVHADAPIEDWSKVFIDKVQKMVSEVEGATCYIEFKRVGRNNMMVEVSIRIERDLGIFQHDFECGKIRAESMLKNIEGILEGHKLKTN